MLKFNGTPQTEITGNIIGKISREPVWISKRQDYVLLTMDSNPGSGYTAILTARSFNKGTKTPTVMCTEEQLQSLNDGDIISIAENGRIDILYEKMSEHNSLLVTERCNCSCIMCPQFINNQEEDKTPSTLRLISLIDKEVKTLGITGGEPTLLVGDSLIEIVATCKEKLPTTKLMLLTNGIKLDDFDYVKKLMLVRHPDLTIDIPLYSDTDTEHNKIIGAKGFYRTINGLYNLARFSQRVGIRIVVHKMTYKRLSQLAQFIYNNFPFVFHIAFMQMETTHLAKENIDLLWIDPYDYNEYLEEAVLYLWRRRMNVSIYNAQLCVLPEALWPFARKSISTWKNIYLEECSECSLRDVCGGFFESSIKLHSKRLGPVKS